jgi:hypothetical protein
MDSADSATVGCGPFTSGSPGADSLRGDCCEQAFTHSHSVSLVVHRLNRRLMVFVW